MSEDLFAPAPPILSGDTADIYFMRTREAMQAAGLNPIAVMEVFPTRDGLLCGMREVLALLREVLPRDADVWALAEGDRISAKEVALRIKARYLSYAVYETAILGMLASETGWATAAAECVAAAGSIPVVSFGARHVHPNAAPYLDYAAITIKAALAFDKYIAPEVSRTVLVDTFMDEAEESVRVARALGDKLQAVRLDTPHELGGVTPELVRKVRSRLDNEGSSAVRIFASGGLSPAHIRRFIESGAPVDGFGVGSYISSAKPNDFTADLKELDGRPIAKRGRTPGITPNPRLSRII